MVKFFRNGFIVKVLVVFGLAVCSTGMWCQQIHKNNNLKKTGGIYGKIQVVYNPPSSEKSTGMVDKVIIEMFSGRRPPVRERPRQVLPQKRPPFHATVYLEGTDLAVKPDSANIFYFSNVKPGKHNIIAKAPGFTNAALKDIELIVRLFCIC